MNVLHFQEKKTNVHMVVLSNFTSTLSFDYLKQAVIFLICAI